MKLLFPPYCFFTGLIVASALPAAAQQILAGPWCGAVTPSSIAATVNVSAAGVQARLAASTATDFSDPLYSPPVTSAAASGNNVRMDLGGLAADTVYYYAVELNGVLQTAVGKTGTFRTMPPPGPYSFRFGFASCGDWHEPGQYVYHTILTENPRFFIHMGDLQYEDTNEDDPAPYRENIKNAITLSPQMGEMFRNLPVSYIWDDHDFSGNTSDKTSEGRAASRQAYRELVPHYPLPAGGPDAAIYQTFNCGRVRFILSDLRSERNRDSDTDNASKSMMGAVQKQWFKDQLIAARDAEAPLIVWMSGVPFISNSSVRDNWGSYTKERTELLEFIRDQDIRNVIIISGDMHALAYDDGRATEDYVDGVRIPVFHAAAMARDGSVKGGPYSGGTSEGPGRYGLMDIADNGSTFSATYQGRIVASATSVSTWKTFVYNSVPVVPRPALSLAAVANAGSILVSWTDNSTVETGYRVERSPAAAGTWAQVGTTAANIVQFSDAAVVAGSSYDYRVITLNGADASAPSNIATATAADDAAYRAWKLAKLGNADAPDDGDGDHDDLTNLEEYLFDLNPVVADRFPWQVSAPAPVTGQVTVSFPTSAGRSYRVQFSPDLGTWTPGSPVITGDGSQKQWTDDGTVTGSVPDVNGKRFYRVAVSAP